MTKYCIDCRYKSPKHYSEWCAHPNFGINVTNGSNHVKMAHSARKDQHECGPDAKWFDPKPPRFAKFLQFFRPAPKV